MSTNTCCPDRSLLHAYQEGTAAGDDFWKVQNHLEDCEACRALLQEFSAADHNTLWISGQPTGHPESGLRSDRPGSGSSAASRYPFLLPPAAPGEMGRLGNYRILKLLGKGGMGYVFHAEDLALCRAVALKVMKPDLDQDVNAAQRFLREARAMASIKHEALVTVFQVGQENGVVYLAMERLEGETLADWQARVRRPRLSAVLRIARGIASGLAAIHERGLVHRDLKPGNLWIERSGNVKILDFGLARLIDDTPLTQAGTVLGTPSFMSPEQARGKPVDPRSDLFSLGSVLYCLCTGKSPFQRSNTTAVLTALALDDPYPIERRNPKLPKALSELVTQLLAKAPEDRPASAEEVLERLSRIEAELAAAKPVEKPVEKAAEPAVAAPARPSASSRTRRLTSERPASRPASQVQPRVPRPKKRPATGRRWLKLSLAAVPVLCVAVVIPWIVSAVHRGHARGATVIEDRHDRSVAVVDDRHVQKVYLADLEPIASEHWPLLPPPPPGMPPFRATGRMSIQGKEIAHGIFMHPPPSWEGSASLTYKLDGAYQLFRARVTLHEGPAHADQPMTFAVYGDDQLLWESKPVATPADTQDCSLSVQGVRALRLMVTSAGESRGAHAVWVDPAVGR